MIARSNEAKALGVEMGAPYFKERERLEKNGVAIFSSNYELYADMSRRVMSILAGFTGELEIYSIDEAFLSLTLPQDRLEERGRELRATVKQWTGIPVCVGIAPTKVPGQARQPLREEKSRLWRGPPPSRSEPRLPGTVRH